MFLSTDIFVSKIVLGVSESYNFFAVYFYKPSKLISEKQRRNICRHIKRMRNSVEVCDHIAVSAQDCSGLKPNPLRQLLAVTLIHFMYKSPLPT